MRAAAFAVLLLAAAPLAARAEPRVEVDLATADGFQATDAQTWYRLFTDLNVDGLTIRQRRGGEQPEIETAGAAPDQVYRVVGLLTSRNELLLPGGKFSSRDARRLAGWLADLKADGPPGEGRAVRPFGLSADELEAVKQDLSQAVAISTRDVGRAEVFAQLRDLLALPLSQDADVAAALRAAEPVAEELQGLSLGSVLACVLRPAGLAFAPGRTERGQVGYRVFAPPENAEVWPIGVSAQDEREKLLPKLFDYLNVLIEDQPLPVVLEALSGRLEAPILLDHNDLAEHEIEVSQALVNLPEKRMTYAVALRKVLGQARLQYELRVDEAGKPFLWVTAL